MNLRRTAHTVIALLAVVMVFITALIVPAQMTGQGTVTGILLKDDGDTYNDAKIYDYEGNMLAQVDGNGSFSFNFSAGTHNFYARCRTPVVGEVDATTIENVTVTEGNVTDVGTIYGIGRPSLSQVTDSEGGSLLLFAIIAAIVAVILALVLLIRRSRAKKRESPPPENPPESPPENS